ncbi:DUF2516 family protein [Luedemannella flava]
MAAVPIFYYDVRLVIEWVIFLVTAVLELVAFVHCLFQRKDAFAVVGSIPKWGWLLILGGSLFVTVVIGASTVGILSFLALTATAFYLLDVRIGLRDVSGGSGRWR